MKVNKEVLAAETRNMQVNGIIKSIQVTITNMETDTQLTSVQKTIATYNTEIDTIMSKLDAPFTECKGTENMWMT